MNINFGMTCEWMAVNLKKNFLESLSLHKTRATGGGDGFGKGGSVGLDGAAMKESEWLRNCWISRAVEYAFPNKLGDHSDLRCGTWKNKTTFLWNHIIINYPMGRIVLALCSLLDKSGERKPSPECLLCMGSLQGEYLDNWHALKEGEDPG